MVTIEDKLKFFKELINKKIEEQREETLRKIDDELNAQIEEKKKEFTKEAQNILNNYKREMQKEKLQIISKAKVEEKKIVLEKRKEIFYEVVEGLFEYTKGFLGTDQYKDFVVKDLKRAAYEMSQSQSINLYFTEKDIERFKAHVLEIFKGKDVNFYVDNEIIGGFIIEDKENSIKFDLSILYRIHSSKDIIGEKLFEVLQ